MKKKNRKNKKAGIKIKDLRAAKNPKGGHSRTGGVGAELTFIKQN